MLRGLTRRYADGGDVDAVLAWGASAAVRLAELDDDGSTGSERARGPRWPAASGRAGPGRVGRSSGRGSGAAARLGAAWSAEPRAEPGRCRTPGSQADRRRQRGRRRGLELADGRTVAFGRSGVDEVELLLSPHDGAPARALSKGASGGELSRVMLALEVVLAGVDPVPTFVFDEVDAGVGGRAAVEIGRRLARLAETAQVLVVTHLPQVAAYADRHLVVTKAEDGSVTESGVTLLDASGRVQELARMLAGQEDSRSARAHAKELLASAAPSGRPDGRPGRVRRRGDPGPAWKDGADASSPHAAQAPPRATGLGCVRRRSGRCPHQEPHQAPAARPDRRHRAPRHRQGVGRGADRLPAGCRHQRGREHQWALPQPGARDPRRRRRPADRPCRSRGDARDRGGAGRPDRRGQDLRRRPADRRRHGADAGDRRGSHDRRAGRAGGAAGVVRRQHDGVPAPRARPAARRRRRAGHPDPDGRAARAGRRSRLPLQGRPGHAAALHPGVPAGADRRRRWGRRAARGGPPPRPDRRRHGLGVGPRR